MGSCSDVRKCINFRISDRVLISKVSVVAPKIAFQLLLCGALAMTDVCSHSK